MVLGMSYQLTDRVVCSDRCHVDLSIVAAVYCYHHPHYGEWYVALRLDCGRQQALCAFGTEQDAAAAVARIGAARTAVRQ